MRNRIHLLLVCIVIVIIAGCSSAPTTIKPNYHSTDPELLRIGGDKPDDKGPEIVNMGSYCLQVIERWKADGKTPDEQTIWSKDTTRKVVPCK